MSRRAIVTGGASGIGAAVARRLAGRGDDVLVADLNTSPDGLPSVSCDVTDPAAVQAAFDDAEKRFGGLDLAVLSAGLATTIGLTPETVDLDAYRRLLGVNVDGVVFGVRAAVPALRRAGGGGIVALASLAGLSPAAGDSLYTLTKFAVVGLVRELGPELAPEGISFNAVCPGFVDTPMINPLRATFEQVGFPIVPVETVVDVILKASNTDGGCGECWLVQPGVEPAPYRFRGVPGARRADGVVVGVPDQ